MDATSRGFPNSLTSLVFPTFNPGSALERTWTDVCRFLEQTSDSWEVLFICDGCSDDTVERLTQLTKSGPPAIRVLSYWPNRGKGFAVRYGLAAARGQWRIFTDVDLAYGFEDIHRVAQVLQAGAPVAIASRTHPDSEMTLPIRLQAYAYKRHLQSLLFSYVVRGLLGLRHSDTQAGLKGLRSGVVEQILPHLTCDGFGFDCELLRACHAFGQTITEVPIRVRYTDQLSTTSARSSMRMLRELWQIRRAWRARPTVAVPEQENQSRRRAA